VPSADLDVALNEMYREQPIIYWPPAQDPDNPNPELDSLYQLLNPPGFLGHVEGTADKRSLVYCTSERNGLLDAIIFISFDPAINLAGIKQWGGLKRRGIQPKQAAVQSDDEPQRLSSVDRAELLENSRRDYRTANTRRNCDNIEIEYQSSEILKTQSGDAPVPANDVPTTVSTWLWTERAMYKDIGAGYHFGL
jgi:hypothetical protein